ncbi:MAG: efflux RND transporter permease subunit [Dysgonamonadaceae bacterium]|jgi:multidrug efflux pump subunit AcrB|nr:efflux RND transporter permease subunit [Dysgonamonadaceae bacterium]
MKPFPVILLFICCLITGLFFIPLLPVKLNPSRDLPQVNVSFNMWGQSARIVEMEVTSKLESMLSRIKGVERIDSHSGNGWGSVNIRLNKYTDPTLARFEISTVIRQTFPSLPEGVSYPYISMSGTNEESRRPFISYTVNAPSSPVLIMQFAEEHIKPELSKIEGIDRIDISGATPMIWKLEYDYIQLRNLHISVDDIKKAIQSYISKEFLGIAKMQKQQGEEDWIRLTLTPDGVAKDFDASLIQVVNMEGKIVHLNQLVTVSKVEEEPSGYYRINGLNSIYLSVTAKDNANQLKVSGQIQQALEDMQSVFPAGYELHLSYDASQYIREELEKIYFRSGLTLLILLCFVLLIYRNLKYLLLITFSMAVNLSIAMILYYFFKVEMQLYSLAGITISLTLIIDNTIVMSDQIIRQGNKKAFLAILTATLTTIASLVIIFFMNEDVRLNLQDFAVVLIINLSVSLVVALFLIPALIEKMKIGTNRKKKKTGKRRFFVRRKRLPVYFNRCYAALIFFFSGKKKWIIPLLILAFGLPVFLLPEKIEEKENKIEEKEDAQESFNWAKLYNSTLGSAFYKEKIKPVSDIALGGTLRLFAQKVSEGSYYANRDETSLFVTASLPNGSTLEQMNFLVKKMEDYIRQYPEVRQFQTNIQNGRRAGINIYFTKKHQKSGFPYLLQSKLISKALELGGGSWAVYGLGDGFNNDVREQAGSYRVKMLGYNYDDLYALAESFRDTLRQHRRIKEVTIDSEFSWYKNDYQEFAFTLDKEKITQKNIFPQQLYASLNPMFGRNIHAGNWNDGEHEDPVRLFSKQSTEMDIWNLRNFPDKIGEREYKLSEIASIEKAQMPQNVAKENQQYRLCLQYEYIGAWQQGNKVLEKHIETFNKAAPLGYFIQKEEYSWNQDKDKGKQYLLLFLIVVIIFFMTSILFNSLKQPLVVIFIIPISFIGLFLTFYWFKLKFDQGGFAAFVLLTGLTVNASIYILNEYNNILHRRKTSKIRAYLKAWNAKIIPVFLTVISTILGFIPFMVGFDKEAFWFPLAAGTIGGLAMSLAGIFLFLPVFLGIKKDNFIGNKLNR